jgi:hypothetical protein
MSVSDAPPDGAQDNGHGGRGVAKASANRGILLETAKADGWNPLIRLFPECRKTFHHILENAGA